MVEGPEFDRSDDWPPMPKKARNWAMAYADLGEEAKATSANMNCIHNLATMHSAS
ncbi:hypothetical protein M758_UG195300 [Ceratodon purpureus]|nr:hypothetical protein M758_UG195300 [Ceratodon purpureus]